MVAMFEDTVIDTGLGDTIDTLATYIWICSTEPVNLASAATSALLGYKSLAAGGHFNAPTASTSPTGRKVVSNAISDGTITTSGTASWWAVGTTAALYAHGTLSAAQAVAAGNTFSLAAFELKIANQA